MIVSKGFMNSWRNNMRPCPVHSKGYSPAMRKENISSCCHRQQRVSGLKISGVDELLFALDKGVGGKGLYKGITGSNLIRRKVFSLEGSVHTTADRSMQPPDFKNQGALHVLNDQ